MKKYLLLSMLALYAPISVWADGQQASITSTPSPAVSNKPLEIRIQTGDLGGNVYCYTWCASVNGTEKTPFTWDGVNTDKFLMSGSGGTYTFNIPNIKDFYGLSDSELEKLTRLGFIAKTTNGSQTADCFVEVVQGRSNAYSGGEGTQTSPFILKTSNDLADFAATPSDWEPGVYAKLEADIDAAAMTSCIGSYSKPYRGNFDGAGHSVKNFHVTNTILGSATGLFGAIDGAYIHDLGIIDAEVSGTTFVGTLIGYAASGNVTRCFASGIANGSSICVGGLIGENRGASITDCYAGVVTSNPQSFATGGIVGKNLGTVSNTYATGKVTGLDFVGGVTGANYANISNSVALNSGINSSNNFVARFGGNNNGENKSDNNYSWEAINKTGNTWKEHGDHATIKNAGALSDKSIFQSLSGWDFNGVWEWRSENSVNYPALRGLDNQKCLLDASFRPSGLEIINNETMLSVGPNPTNGAVNIISTNRLELCAAYTLDGRCVANRQCNGANECTIDLSSTPDGVYVMQVVTSAGNSSVFKIIKK